MKVDKLEGGRQVAWNCIGDHPEWKGTHLTFELKPGAQGKKTALRFKHGGWQSADGWMATCSYTWAQVLERLKAYAETGERSPYFPG